MEHQKFSHEEQKWADELAARLDAEFPDAHIRVDAEHFIYEITKPSGKRVEVHIPRWSKIPFKHADGTLEYVGTEDHIRSDLAK